MDAVHVATILAATLAVLAVYAGHLESDDDTGESYPAVSDTWDQSHVHYDPSDKLPRWALAVVVVCVVLFVLVLLLLAVTLYAMCVRKSYGWLTQREAA